MKYFFLILFSVSLFSACKNEKRNVYKPKSEKNYVSPAEGKSTVEVLKGFEVYDNKRFGFCVHYPDDFIPQGVSQNGDGQVILSPKEDVKITVWGSLMGRANLDGENENSIADEFDLEMQMSPNVSYHKKSIEWYVVSGKDEGKIYYKKCFLNRVGEFNFLLIEYPEGKAKKYNTMVSDIAGRFPVCG